MRKTERGVDLLQRTNLTIVVGLRHQSYYQSALTKNYSQEKQNNIQLKILGLDLRPRDTKLNLCISILQYWRTILIMVGIVVG